jgi:hypothetical protein
VPAPHHVDPDPVDPCFGSVHGVHAGPVLQGPCEGLGCGVARQLDVPGCDNERSEQTWMGGRLPRLERAAARWSRVDVGIGPREPCHLYQVTTRQDRLAGQHARNSAVELTFVTEASTPPRLAVSVTSADTAWSPDRVLLGGCRAVAEAAHIALIWSELAAPWAHGSPPDPAPPTAGRRALGVATRLADQHSACWPPLGIDWPPVGSSRWPPTGGAWDLAPTQPRFSTPSTGGHEIRVLSNGLLPTGPARVSDRCLTSCAYTSGTSPLPMTPPWWCGEVPTTSPSCSARYANQPCVRPLRRAASRGERLPRPR